MATVVDAFAQAQAQAQSSRCEGTLPIAQICLHGDCHLGNILCIPEGQPGAGLHFVDLDNARTGFAEQDLWILLIGENRVQNTQ